jgi:hypothetical protein
MRKPVKTALRLTADEIETLVLFNKFVRTLATHEVEYEDEDEVDEDDEVDDRPAAKYITANSFFNSNNKIQVLRAKEIKAVLQAFPKYWRNSSKKNNMDCKRACTFLDGVPFDKWTDGRVNTMNMILDNYQRIYREEYEGSDD